MIKKVFIFFVLILSLNSKAQNWAPLDTGIHSFVPYGLLADNVHGNLFAFGNKWNIGGLDVWTNNKWENWYPNIQFATYGEDIAIFNDTIIFFSRYYEGNDILKPRTAILQFTNSSDLDTLKVFQNQDWLPAIDASYCTYQGNLILFPTANNPSGLNSIATFDGDTIIPIGDSTVGFAGMGSACVYKGELYATGYLNLSGSIRGVMKLTSLGWQTIYQIQGSLSSILGMMVYNSRLYIYGGIFLEESPSNLGHSIIAYDGSTFDTLNGGIRNPTGYTGANIYDVSISKNKLYVTGNFLLAGNTTARGIAYWNDTTWCNGYKDLDSTGNFFRIETLNDTIYEVAEFHNMYGSNYGWIAKLHNNYSDTCSAPSILSVNEITNFNGIKIYPNPTTSIINILDEDNQLQNATIQIKNYLGQLVFTAPFTSQINLHSLSAGMYFLTIEDKENKKTVKIIKLQ